MQRYLLLLHSEVLLVLDTVELEKGSKLQRSSAYFHNILHQFCPYVHNGLQGAQIVHSDGSYSFFWFQPNGNSPAAKYQSETLSTESTPRTTNFVNITFRLNGNKPTRIAYVFMGPNVNVANAKLIEKSDRDISCIQISINNNDYQMLFASLTAPVSQRMKHLGFGGYASVQISNSTFHLGLDSNLEVLNQWTVDDELTMQAFIRSLISSTQLPTGEASSTTMERKQCNVLTYGTLLFMALMSFGTLFWMLKKCLRNRRFKMMR